MKDRLDEIKNNENQRTLTETDGNKETETPTRIPT